jgi:hypothetical protein
MVVLSYISAFAFFNVIWVLSGITNASDIESDESTRMPMSALR